MKKITIALYFVLIISVLLGQNQQFRNSSDYERYGLKPGNIPEVWEDGMRTGGVRGTFEWWYFDAHLDDGTTVVIVFNTKPFTKIRKGLVPFIIINIDKPDGTSIKKSHFGKVNEFSASDTRCDVVIGKNYFRGDLKNYDIHFEDSELKIDAKINRTSESWRPMTGIMSEKKSGDYFAWLVPVPKGETEITYTYEGKEYNLKGSCYHDHNFGNKNMVYFINHWYWSRSEIGPYTVIASESILTEKFDNFSSMVFNLSKDGRTIADNSGNVKLYRTYDKMQDAGGRPLSDDLKFIYESENEEYKYEYTLVRKKNLVEDKILGSEASTKFARGLVKLFIGFDGAYYRMSGTANLKVYKNKNLIEEHSSDKAIWELMYFGEPYE